MAAKTVLWLVIQIIIPDYSGPYPSVNALCPEISLIAEVSRLQYTEKFLTLTISSLTVLVNDEQFRDS